MTSSASTGERRMPLKATADLTSLEGSSSETAPTDIALGPEVTGTLISCELLGGASLAEPAS